MKRTEFNLIFKEKYQMNWTRLADRLSISSRSNIRSADPILKSNIQSINRITVSGLNIPSANRIIISRSNMWCADQFIVSRPNIWSADWITISRSNIRYRILIRSVDWIFELGIKLSLQSKLIRNVFGKTKILLRSTPYKHTTCIPRLKRRGYGREIHVVSL